MLTPAGSKCRIVRRNAVALREGIARRPLRSPPCSEMIPAQVRWDRVLSLIVSARRRPAPHAVIPFHDRPLWRRPPEIW